MVNQVGWVLKLPRRSRKKEASARKRLETELAKWGIDKKALGAAALGIVITAILHALNTAFGGLDDDYSEEDAYADSVIEELEEQGDLPEVTSRLSKEDLKRALKSFFESDTLHSEWGDYASLQDEEV